MHGLLNHLLTSLVSLSAVHTPIRSSFVMSRLFIKRMLFERIYSRHIGYRKQSFPSSIHSFLMTWLISALSPCFTCSDDFSVMGALHSIPVLFPVSLFFPMMFVTTILFFSSFHHVCIRSAVSGGMFLRYIPPFFRIAPHLVLPCGQNRVFFLICGVDWTYDDPTNLLIHRHAD